MNHHGPTALGQLEHVSAPSLEATYSYGIEGMREEKVVTKAGVTTTTEDFYSGQQLTARKVTSGTSTTLLRFVYGPGGTPLELITETGGVKTSYAYQLDWGGSVVGLTTATGATVATYSYDPWGRELSRSGSLADVNPLRYRGYVADDETGLYNLPARYYDPVIARFTSVDPAPPKAANPRSLNGYVYCEGDPVTFVDPDGRDILFGNYYPSGTQDRYEPDIPQRQGSRSRGAHGTSSSGQRERQAADARRGAPPVTSLHQPSGFVPVLSMADRYLTAGVVGSLGAVAAYAVSAGALATYGALSPAAVEAAQRVASTVGDPSDEASAIAQAAGRSPVPIPGDYVARVANNGNGYVFQRLGASGNADMIRIMGPKPGFPNGYAVIYNGMGQPIDLAGRTLSRADWHLPLY